VEHSKQQMRKERSETETKKKKANWKTNADKTKRIRLIPKRRDKISHNYDENKQKNETENVKEGWERKTNRNRCKCQKDQPH